MAPFPMEILCELWAPARNPWTAPPCRPSVRRTRSNRCPRPSAGRPCGSDSFSCTICLSKPLTNEVPAQPDYWLSPSCALCLDFYFRSGASSPVSMNQKDPQPILVAVVGPTASGKSALGVCLAGRFSGEVVACDSTQLYRGFDIGTAKPRVEERGGIAHHLIDVLDPGEAATAGRYRELALGVLQDLRRRGKRPILTVGTGLYLRALLEGLADIPQRSEEIRERLRASTEGHPPGHLHRILVRLDPQTVKKIAAADEQKLIRAIEVCLLARMPISEVHRTGRKPLEGWRVVKIGLMPSREGLYKRIHARTSSMIEQGWMQEVQDLLKSGWSENAKPFDFIGYREVRAVLSNELSEQQAREAIQQATRRYAKRQLTWFRKEAGVQWFSGFGDDAELQSAVCQHLQSQGVEPGRGAPERSV